MEILFSGVIGGLLAAIGFAIFYSIVKDPEKRKKYQSFVLIPAISLVPVVSNSPLKYKILGLIDSKYRVHYVMNEKMKVLFQDPIVKAQIDKSIDHAQNYSFFLSKIGIKHLEIKDLDKWNDYRIQMAENYTPYCAGLLKGHKNQDVVMTALGTLDESDLAAFSDLIVKGAFRKLKNEGSPETHVNFFREGLKMFQTHLSDQDKIKFQKNLSNPASASDPDACWVILKVLKGSKMLADTERSKFLKFLAGI